ncbi:hypothetical protein VB636_22405 [Paracoccus sp. APAP_BH8]|uniref:Twin-arginine translocation signal domain-containing protein n=1 Tax=Paracoccus pantotrophus TaxID=82367 RepID=A0A7H9BT61_PARPN|nr:hypothetical protein [Paracoccus pantotrophus]MDF3856207.1 hypothetical protein [Paracoccus pantotrophus]QLH14076.1 hypothetical protein HYQ43_07460 [Paracoccus pantotrophus]SFP01736.1 hypothetical protein SAMN04244567_03625 [Paracoccus pantotrophus]
MKRRDLMRLAPAALVAGAAPPAGAVGVEETPVMKLFREWQPLHQFVCTSASAGMPDEEWNPLHDRVWDIADRIFATPAQTAQDFIAKVICHTVWGEHGLPDEGQNPSLWAEARALIGGAA